MKNLMYIFLIVILSITSLYGQVPEGFNYQAVIRDNAGEIIPNQTVGVEFNIRQGTANGTVIYTESHTTNTNEFGLINLVIGSGSVTGDFTLIDWSNTPYFLETSVDQSGGTTYTSIGTSQLLTVPYAMYAKSSADTPKNTSELNNDSNFVVEGNSSNMQPYNTVHYIVALNGTYPSQNLTDGEEEVQSANSNDPFIGQIIMFAGPFAPRHWAFCNGQLLSIADHSALFSLLGTTYGGDGVTTFALPDLRGRVPVHSGYSQGPGLTNRPMGQKSGSETVD